MNEFTNCYQDDARAEEYAKLEFANTYMLAYRDLPSIFRAHVKGKRALDFGCGTGRSTRFLRQHGFAATGIDISAEMLRHARQADAEGEYRLIADGDFSALNNGTYDLVLSAFTFDNIATMEMKVRLFAGLRELLSPEGRIVSIVSAPEIYLHEWASFSTQEFPENHQARSGDRVKIIVTDHGDRRPVDDIIWMPEAYASVYEQARLEIVHVYKPLATGDEPHHWVNETSTAPWHIYVLGAC